MGSLEEAALFQMAFEFMEPDSSSQEADFPHDSSKYFSAVSVAALQEVVKNTSKTEKMVLESVLRHLRSVRSKNISEVKKKLVVSMNTDGLKASLLRTSCVSSRGCPAGEYEYIEVRTRQGNSTTGRLIVDIDFKSQFDLARPTPIYRQMTDTLPSVFVGTDEKLNQIIYLLCAAAKQSFRDRGLHVPPWRTAAYMQRKWLSREKKKSNESPLVPCNLNQWIPPAVQPKRRDLRGGSALSSQFSGASINCC